MPKDFSTTGKGALSLFFSLLALTVALAANLALYFTTQAQTATGRQAHAALCVLDGDLQGRISNGRAFLHAHPAGIPGIPASTLAASLANQQSTLDALRTSMTCP